MFCFRTAAIILLSALSTVPVCAQWLDHRTPGIPRNADGTANLSAPAPQTANGKPDLSGIWRTDPSPFGDMQRAFPDLVNQGFLRLNKYFISVFAGVDPANVPMRPGAAQLFEQRMAAGFGKDIPTAGCLPAGLPMGAVWPLPRRIVQTKALIVTWNEGPNPARTIHLDGRELPDDPLPDWMGYSVGSWDDDTLVVDSAGFNDRTWLDAMGHPHTEAMHLTERWRRRDFGHLEVEVTIDDPEAYTRPFTFAYTQTLLPDTDLLEFVCAENEKDQEHLAGQ